VEASRTDSLWGVFREALAHEGFPVSGVVDYQLAKGVYTEHAERYRQWIQDQKHGEMAYLERGLERRLHPELVFPELKSVITVLKPYPPQPVGDSSLRYARYLNGPDYHEVLKKGLERAMAQVGSAGHLPDGFRYKICVDTSAVLERTWAALSGLGWIGKNTLLIHPQLGSYVFIGVVFANLEWGRGPELLKDYCGNCSRCISACPTRALSVHDLDSRACISYLTLEKRGMWMESLPTHGFVAGCDLCQEVCPYNQKPVKRNEDEFIAPHLVLDPQVLEQESEAAYRSRIEGTALERIRYADFRRNLEATPRGTRKE